MLTSAEKSRRYRDRHKQKDMKEIRNLFIYPEIKGDLEKEAARLNRRAERERRRNEG